VSEISNSKFQNKKKIEIEFKLNKKILADLLCRFPLTTFSKKKKFKKKNSKKKLISKKNSEKIL
jgi:hypothetical protein